MELLTLDFFAATEEIVRQNIMFRYNLQKAKCNFLQVKLKEVGELVKLKNPSLLMHLQKGNTQGKMPLQSSIFSNTAKK